MTGAQVIQNIRHRELSHIILCAPESDDHTEFKPYIEELRRIYYSEREPKVEFVNDKVCSSSNWREEGFLVFYLFWLKN